MKAKFCVIVKGKIAGEGSPKSKPKSRAMTGQKKTDRRALTHSTVDPLHKPVKLVAVEELGESVSSVCRLSGCQVDQCNLLSRDSELSDSQAFLQTLFIHLWEVRSKTTKTKTKNGETHTHEVRKDQS